MTHPTTTTSQSDTPVPSSACPHCGQTFASARGVMSHVGRKHKDLVNAAIVVPTVDQRRWTDEELRRLATREAEAIHRGGERFINQYLLPFFPERGLGSLRSQRRRQVYRDLVRVRLAQLASESALSGASSSAHPLPAPTSMSSSQCSSSTPGLQTNPATPEGYIRVHLPDLVPSMGWCTTGLVDAAEAAVAGSPNAGKLLVAWLRSVFPHYNSTTPNRYPKPRRPDPPVTTSRRTARIREYARLQTLWSKGKRSSVAHYVLDPESYKCNSRFSLEEQVSFWGPVFSTPGAPLPANSSQHPKPIGSDSRPLLGRAVSLAECANRRVPSASAAGPDDLQVRDWNKVPPLLQSIVLNILYILDPLPKNFILSRTVLIPKVPEPSHPNQYRPISVASVLIRHLNKILAARVSDSCPFDERQRAFRPVDGCAENATILAAVLDEAQRKKRFLNMAILDISKAFDTVSHEAVLHIARSVGLHERFVRYLERTYGGAQTSFDVLGRRSRAVPQMRGVRQGDPLSPILFNLVMDAVLASADLDVGFTLGGERVGVLAFADDLVLIAETETGLQHNISALERVMNGFGLFLNSEKCRSLSVIPSGKTRKVKVVDEPIVELLAGERLMPIKVNEAWRYLGVLFTHSGALPVSPDLKGAIARLTRAPLRPQQRLEILRGYVIPAELHRLTLGRVNRQTLADADRAIRAAIRRWLRLPRDTALGFFHAPVRAGGLGMPSLELFVPGLTLSRLSRLGKTPLTQAASKSHFVLSKLDWARKCLVRDGSLLSTKAKRERYWIARLHSSVDGKELRSAPLQSVSTAWIRERADKVPARDYVQYMHVWINSLSTRVRTSRGTRRDSVDVRCRAGCDARETAAHILQSCWRTHNFRLMRHNALTKTIAAKLREGGYDVLEEPRIANGDAWVKPDIVASRDGFAAILDVQIISGAVDLETANEMKSAKYRSEPIFSTIRTLTGATDVTSEGITLTWRGVMSPTSAIVLRSLGITRATMCGLVTRVLQGSHTTFNRWGRMTETGRRQTRRCVSGGEAIDSGPLRRGRVAVRAAP